MEGVNHHHRGDFDLVVGAVLARPGGQRVVVADGAGQVVHQTQLPLHRTLDDQGDRVKLGAPLDKLRYSRGKKERDREGVEGQMGMRETKDRDMNKCGRKELITETGRGLGARVKQRQTGNHL